ncbi:unnamed protein product, partial [Allacma fusca]
PTINKCCPEGSFYNEGKDSCVELSIELKEDLKDPVNSLPTEIVGSNLSSYKIEPLLEDFISVPSSLVIDLDLRNNSSTSKDFRFRLRPYFPIDACNKGNFIVTVQLNQKFQNESTGNIESKFQPSNSTMSLLSPQNIQANFTSRGQIKIGNEYYSPPEFCLIG